MSTKGQPKAIKTPPLLSASVGKADAKVYPLTTMSAAETAEHLGWTTRELEFWHSQGRGPARRSCGNFVRWEVETWVSNFMPARAALLEFPALADVEADVSEFDQPFDAVA